MAKEYIEREHYCKNVCRCAGLENGCSKDKCSLWKAPAADVLEVPPVKIGDKAFFVIDGRIYETEICLMTWHKYRDYTFTEIRGEVYPNHTVAASFEEFGKVVFLTREEAVEVIQKMNGERRDNECG